MAYGQKQQYFMEEMKRNLEDESTREQPVLRCLKCNASGMEQFIQILDDRGCPVWWKCINCTEEYNQNGRLEPGATQVRIKPCSSCKTNDPNHFVIQECAESRDIVLVCGWCDVIYQTLLKAWRPEIVNAECECGNKEKDLFEVKYVQNGTMITIKCFLCDRIQDIKDQSPITCRKCTNDNPDRFELIEDEHGKTVETVCQSCKTRQPVDKGFKLILEPDTNDTILDKERVTSPNQVKKGDHIAFHRKIGYWHHAIVVEVDESTGYLTLIEYAKREWDSWFQQCKDICSFKKFAIQENVKPIDFVKDMVYRMCYKVGECLSPSKVIEKAREKIGEQDYNLFTNNCEHFARWAKTGKEVSYQVIDHMLYMVKNAIQCVICCAARVGSHVGAKLGIDLGIPYVTETAERILGKAGCFTLLDGTATGLMVVVQVCFSGGIIYHARKKKNEGLEKLRSSIESEEWKRKETLKIENEYEGTCVGESLNALCQIGFSQACFYGGQVMFPAAYLAGFIGASLGVILGYGCGHLVKTFVKNKYSET